MPLTPTIDELVAIEACREAARRYCRGVDRLDPDEMRSAYWPEATDDHGTFVGNAWDFVEHCMVGHQRWAWTMHLIANHTVELDADPTGRPLRARGEIYNVSYLQRIDEPILDIWFGRYLDRYERRDDEWRIIERICVHEGDRTASTAEGMPLDVERFRQGNHDRPAGGRPLGR